MIRHQPQPGWSFHELIAGPLSATPGQPRSLDERLGSRTLFAQGGPFNVGEVTIDPTFLGVRFVDEQGTVMFTHTITPDQGRLP